ncbi:restriction endonuclease subunit S [Cloacibacterium sp.]|uniref:restriction endonuclease subunit S n=1 Tax=Cloacibacterium sp. TaxID=1913682 RepID=UPI0035ADC6CC
MKKLGEVADIGRGKSKHRPRDAEFLFGGKYPFIQTGDVRKADLYLTEFTQTYSEAGLQQSKLWNEDTLCITIAANIAETSILKIKACFPDSIIGLIPKENRTIVLFVKYLFDKFKIEIQNLSQGAAQDNLNQDKLSKIEFTFPNIEEQKKISSFLFSIDERIQTQKKIISELSSQMSSLKDLIFEQRLRFKDNKGNKFSDWKQCKLEDICEKQSSNISANKIEDNFGDYPIYGATGILKNIDFYEIESDYVSIIKDGAGVGRLFYCKGKSSVLGTLDVIKSKGVNLYFILLLLSRVDFKKYITGSTIPHIYFKDYKKEKIQIPSQEEQEKIAQFLKNLDNKINVEIEILTQYETQKKYLLQNLFV